MLILYSYAILPGQKSLPQSGYVDTYVPMQAYEDVWRMQTYEDESDHHEWLLNAILCLW